MAEFEQRLERAYHLTSADQLRSLVADLPASASLSNGMGTVGPALVPSSDVPARGAVFAMMGGAERGEAGSCRANSRS
ncbi:MAG: hypothetical protein ABR499_19735 [Gemmatimonadaceae bacterium]